MEILSVFDYLDNEDSSQTMYHGTTTAHNLNVGDKILPTDICKNTSEVGRKKNNDCIFLTTDKNYAKIYAGRAVKMWGGKPVVYTVVPLGLTQFSKSAGMDIYTAEGAFITKQELLTFKDKHRTNR